VPVRCCSHPELSEPDLVVAGGAIEAEVLAAQKLAEKYFTEQSKKTRWGCGGRGRSSRSSHHVAAA
jgi:hypothetical protein